MLSRDRIGNAEPGGLNNGLSKNVVAVEATKGHAETREVKKEKDAEGPVRRNDNHLVNCRFVPGARDC